MIRTRYSRSRLKLRFDPVSRMCLAAVEEGATPGLVVLVAAQGRTLFHEAFGARQLVPRRLPALPDTMYDVASLTKAVATSVLAMQEIGSGRLTLDTKVATLLSDLSGRTGTDAGHDAEAGPKHDSEDGGSEHRISELARDDITVRQLLSHSSGLPAHRPFWKQAAHSPAERLAIERLAAREPLTHPPGTRAVYSDLGFILLGWLLERLTGKRLDMLFQDGIARPLGLAASTFVNLADSEARARLLGDRTVAATQISAERHGLVLGEVDDQNAFAMGGIAGHAGLFSTAGDLAAIATALVASFRGQGQGNDGLVARDVIRQFWSPSGVPGSTWRLGWDGPAESGSQAGERLSRAAVGHLAFTGCSLWIDPLQEVIVVLLSNRVHPAVPTDDRFRRFRPTLHDAVLAALGYDGR
jgi:CubicO group peptidase (beta-lactamase class C family)